MISDITKNKLDYSVLAGLAIIYLTIVITFKTMPLFVVGATSIFAILYLIWGITHHLRLRSFTSKIVLEYFLVAALALVVVSTLLI